MPLFDLECKNCGEVKEDVLVWMGKESPLCCDTPMIKLLSVYAMLKFKGEGGYPSRRKEITDRKAMMSRKQVPYVVES